MYHASRTSVRVTTPDWADSVRRGTCRRCPQACAKEGHRQAPDSPRQRCGNLGRDESPSGLHARNYFGGWNRITDASHHVGNQQATGAGLRQADGLLPLVDSHARGHTRHTRYHHAHGCRSIQQTLGGWCTSSGSRSLMPSRPPLMGLPRLSSSAGGTSAQGMWL